MTRTENDAAQTSRATQPLQELRDILQGARTSDDAERIHAALVEVVDGLISHGQRQARAIDDLRSDMGHKQGIVSDIRGGEHREPSDKTVLIESANDELDL